MKLQLSTAGQCIRGKSHGFDLGEEFDKHSLFHKKLYNIYMSVIFMLRLYAKLSV